MTTPTSRLLPTIVQELDDRTRHLAALLRSTDKHGCVHCRKWERGRGNHCERRPSH